MKKRDLDAILNAMLESFTDISDLVFSAGRPLQVENFGVLKPASIYPDIQRLTPYQTEQIAIAIIGNNRALLRHLHVFGSCDCSYALSERARFRVNVFKQRGNFSIVMRKLQSEIPTFSSLGLPDIFQEISREKNGLVLLTGATGSGKTTTLAAILNEINENQAVHVVTLEDPIEFVHKHKKATFSQRELGQDFDEYPNGLRAALRQAPKVILVGEMRDRETVEVALTAAETGHLVLSTLHTIDAGQSVNRILGMFELAEETQLRLRIADTLRYVVSQRLAPKRTGGRILISEIMGPNLRTRETFALGEADARTFYEIIEANATFGWTTFDQSIVRAFEADLITEETALLYATKKGKVARLLDNVKKARGASAEENTGLRLDMTGPRRTAGKA